MGRHLLFFEYIGTRYCGVVRSSHPPNSKCEKVIGVQDVLERAFEQLRPVDPVRLHVSSRTDAGVHALCNTAHFDLRLRSRRTNEPREIPSESITAAINHQLKGEDVRVLRTLRVADNFHSQHLAMGRTYLYRIAFPCGARGLPIVEHNRCWPIDHDLDIEAMRAASSSLVGTHDFSAFRNASFDDHFKSPIKTMESIDFRHGHGFLDHHYGKIRAPLEFLEISFRSRSFLYRQVRRMTGALVSVGLGRLAPSDISEILESRDNSHMHSTRMAPPHGLYLKDVHYNDDDLNFNPSSVVMDQCCADTSVT